MSKTLWIVPLMGVFFVACGGDDGDPVPVDGGPADAGVDGGPELDAGPDDGGPMYPDSGPPPTGCELLDGAVTDDSGVAGDGGAPPTFAPDGYPPVTGPGGPSVAFDAAELHTMCAALDGGERDRDHHNTVLMVDGRLWMPWAHEGGVGGITAWDFSDPCSPVLIGTADYDSMRETHAAGLWLRDDGTHFMATTSLDGIMFWDITDPSAPMMIHDMSLPGVTYPDSYARVVLSIFWQAPYVYVGGADNGVFIVDASDPGSPELVGVYEPIPELRVGGVYAIGNLLVIQATEGARTNLVDISDPASPRPIPGGTFIATDGTLDRFGRPRLKTFYFGHVNGNRAYFARHVLGGGLSVFDIADPTAPTFIGNWDAPPIANGGYVFLKNQIAFVGLSEYGAAVDVSDPSDITMAARFDMTGDLDTIVPIGNVVAVSVDDDAVADEATLVMPFEEAPDTRAPVVNMVVPRDGAEGVALSSRVGITLDEFPELRTVYRGSFRVQVVGSDVPLSGHYSGQEGALNFWPAAPLAPGTTYEVVVPAGGITDVSGNAVAAEFRSTFTTTACD